MRTFVIAEAGVNHNGDPELAVRMVKAAAEAGADAVKFQTFRAEDIVTAGARKADYQKKNDGTGSQLEMLKKLEIADKTHTLLMEACTENGIEFMSTPFSVNSARFLAALGMKTWKIPSGEITNRPLLEYIGSLQPTKIIMSTGMSTLAEIKEALEVLHTAGADRKSVYLLHCNTAYPTPFDDVNLLALDTLAKLPVAAVGYSDHTEGIAIAPAAVARGAAIIEKHFTLDRNMAGPDHAASLLPDEFRQMVRDIRAVEAALGSPEKKPTESERKNMVSARKSLVAMTFIAAGEKFSPENLGCKRPGDGLSPMFIHSLEGRRSKHSYQPDEQIKEDEII